MDFFAEKIVYKRKGYKDYLFYAGIALASAVAVLILQSIEFLSGFSFLVFVGLIVASYFLITSKNIEFEYIVTNNELDIDIIIAQRKRKRIFSSDCKEFEILAKYPGEYFNQVSRVGDSIIDACSSRLSPNVYFALLNYKGKRTIVLFEPNENMMELFRRYIAAKIKI